MNAEASRRVTVNRRELAVGITLVLMGVLMPALLDVKSMGIYPDIYAALGQGEPLYVILASLKLVVLNGVRSFPHYLGAFFMGESIHLWGQGGEIRLVKHLLVCSIIPTVYLLIEKIYGIRYDFSLTAMLVITMLVILGKINFNMINIAKKALLVAMMVMAFQWLDVMPSLAGYAFGRGETSNDIKNAAILLDATAFLQGTAVLFFVLLFFNAMLLLKLILDENNLMLMSEENERNQRILMETQMRVLENRTYMELQHLVHDLKSPLTSMQALVGVLKMGCQDQRQNAYLNKIELGVERMSVMISEILYEDRRSPICTQDLLDSVLAQASAGEYISMIQAENLSPDLLITVNKIRFSRAIINLLENAFYAVDPQRGHIQITVDEYYWMDTLFARFQVADNGKGIPTQQLDAVWKWGFSTRSSLGLGLSFVQRVVDDNSGSITIDSQEGKGTTITILIPAEYAQAPQGVEQPEHAM